MRFKIGNFEILAERNTKRPELGELGGTGTSIFGGIVAEEYNKDLSGQKAITVYEKMRKSDARVKSSILVCELPLRAIEWNIEPASDSSKDEEIAESLKDNLFHMTISWDSFLHHALLSFPFGFSMFEKVWEIVAGRVQYRKFAPRLPKTLSKWLLDEHGGLAGIEQAVMINDTYKTITIPSDKLLVFTNEKEGSNFGGVSILRSAYKHWYYKDNLYRIDGISAERHATGVPYFKHPAGATKDDTEKLDTMGQHLQAHEQQYIRLAEGYEFDIKGVTGAIRDIMPSIEHHNKAIAESVLADFLNLGAGDVGSWALSKDKSSFFLMSLKAVGKNLCDTFNAYAIPQWVKYNYGDVDLPRLTHGKLDTRNLQEYATAVTGLLQVGGLTYSNEVENSLREMLDMPPKEKEPAKQSNPVTHKEIFQGIEAPKKPRRKLTRAEEYIKFDEINKRLDDAELEIANSAAPVRLKQIEKLADVATKIIEKKQISRLDDIDVPFRAEMIAVIESHLAQLADFGRTNVLSELSGQARRQLTRKTNSDNEVWNKELLHARAKAAANAMAGKLKSAVTFDALRQIRSGIVDKAALVKAMDDASVNDLTKAGQFMAAESFNIGRAAEAAYFKDDIVEVIYTSLLDENSCEVCTPLDGQSWEPDDPRTDRYANGNPDCLGGSRCRCFLSYVHAEEVPSGAGLDEVRKEFYKRFVNKPYEVVLILDNKGNKILFKRGGLAKVPLTDEELELIKKSKPSVFMHNHSEGTAFSPDDILFGQQNGIGGLEIAGKEYLYKLKPVGNTWTDINATKFMADFDKIRQDLLPKYQGILDKTGNYRQTMIEFSNEIIEILAKQYNLVYTRGQQ